MIIGDNCIFGSIGGGQLEYNIINQPWHPVAPAPTRRRAPWHSGAAPSRRVGRRARARPPPRPCAMPPRPPPRTRISKTEGRERVDATGAVRARNPPRGGMKSRGYRRRGLLWADSVYRTPPVRGGRQPGAAGGAALLL